MDLNKDAIVLQRVANCDVFVGKPIETLWGRIFGGQTLSQSMIAASLTVPDETPIHSLHCYFILPGNINKEILFDVDRIRDGGSFKTRQCKAMQDNSAIFLGQYSFHSIESCQRSTLYFQIKLENLIAPLRIEKLLESFDPNSDTSTPFIGCDRVSLHLGDNFEVTIVKISKDFSDWKNYDKLTWREHCGLLSFLSDYGLAYVVRSTLKEVKNWKSSISLDHSMHFHRPLEIKADEWTIWYTESAVSLNGRGLGRAHVFNLKYELLATISQELFLIPADNPAPKL